MILFTLKDKLGHYLSKENDFEKGKVPKTTRHFQDAKFFIHPYFYLEGFKTIKVEVKETVHRTGY